MTCRTWRTLFSPLRWDSGWWPTSVSSLSRLHNLEEIISLPLSSTAKDHVHYLHLNTSWQNNANDSSRFLSAWRSLSRCLPQVTFLVFGALEPNSRPPLKLPSISLRPYPQPLLHLRNLELVYVTFPSFSALFRDIGALPSPERLNLRHIEWNGACDPEFPLSSTAIFGSIKYIYADDCTDDGWPLIWMFTASSLRYRHPWRVLDDDEETRTRPVRTDVRAIGQAFRWVFGNAKAANRVVILRYVDCAPKGI